MLARLLVATLVVVAPMRARAESDQAVALLPLDAAPRLEIYGQPVASEIARALVAGGIDVVVVGPKMAVPERATLIVDGTILRSPGPGKDDAVVLSVRVRNRADGVLVATLQASAPSLANIDKAAAEVSAQVLPAVRTRLAELAPPAPPPATVVPTPTPPSTVAPAPRPTLVAIVARDRSQEVFRAALSAAVTDALGARSRTPVETPIAKLSKRDAATTVKATGQDLGMAFEVLGYEVLGKTVPLARARVRVRVADAAGLVFDRIVITDSVVGDRGMQLDAVAARVAREVLDILRPHFARKVATWR